MPKPQRRTACTHVSRAMQAARRRSGFDYSRRFSAGPKPGRVGFCVELDGAPSCIDGVCSCWAAAGTNNCLRREPFQPLQKRERRRHEVVLSIPLSSAEQLGSVEVSESAVQRATPTASFVIGGGGRDGLTACGRRCSYARIWLAMHAGHRTRNRGRLRKRSGST